MWIYVEDHEDTRELVRFMLSQSTIDVVTAGTLEDGLRLASESKFDLYLLDFWLPDGYGTELSRHIREFDKTTPIVFFSAAAYESDQNEALDSGAQAFLTKPRAPIELCDLVHSLISVTDPGNMQSLIKQQDLVM
jgi:DNA-binding response OmpR family regulator